MISSASVNSFGEKWIQNKYLALFLQLKEKEESDTLGLAFWELNGLRKVVESAFFNLLLKREVSLKWCTNVKRSDEVKSETCWTSYLESNVLMQSFLIRSLGSKWVSKWLMFLFCTLRIKAGKHLVPGHFCTNRRRPNLMNIICVLFIRPSPFHLNLKNVLWKRSFCQLSL